MTEQPNTGALPMNVVRARAERLLAGTRAFRIDLTGTNGLMAALVRLTLERILEVELGFHLGYGPHATAGRGSGNSRNGSTHRTLRTDVGRITVSVPRDRAGVFVPQLVPKHARQVMGYGQTVLGLYSRTQDESDIAGYLNRMYPDGTSQALVQKVAMKLRPIISVWRNRPLSRTYPLILLDDIIPQPKSKDQRDNPVVRFAVGIGADESTELLGLWALAPTTPAMAGHREVVVDLRRRGVVQVGSFCCDGRTESTSMLSLQWPESIVLPCVSDLFAATLPLASQSKNQATPTQTIDDRRAQFAAATRHIITRPTRALTTDEANQRTTWPSSFAAHEPSHRQPAVAQ